jgi:acetyltransferase-like isoleucine patch superfamily enzyme
MIAATYRNHKIKAERNRISRHNRVRRRFSRCLAKNATAVEPGALPWPAAWRRGLARMFGAKIGKNVSIKPRVNIHFPRKFSIGDHSLIGEEVFILNFEPISIGEQCCISQRAFLCTGNHDYRDWMFSYRNRPIRTEDGAWVGAQVFVAPGVTVGEEAVAAAGSIVTKDLPPRWYAPATLVRRSQNVGGLSAVKC